LTVKSKNRVCFTLIYITI